MPPPARTATEDDDQWRPILGSLRRPDSAASAAPRCPDDARDSPARSSTPPSALPVTVAQAHEYARADSDEAIFERLIAAVTLETERSVLWRAIVAQRRRLVVDAPLAPQLSLEPTTAVVSLTRWTDANAVEAVPADVYHAVSSDPGGTVVNLRCGKAWPSAERDDGCLRAHLRLWLGGHRCSSGNSAHDSYGGRRAVPEHRSVCGCGGAGSRSRVASR